MPPSKLTPLPPELALEWHPTRNGDLTPDQVSRGSTKKVWWQCQQGHYWEGSPDSRSRSGVSKPCPYCIDKRIWSGYNDLATRLPELMLEWDYDRNTVDPTRLAPRTHDKVWWQCQQCSHSWQASPHNRVRTGCPECAQQKNTLNQRKPQVGRSLAEVEPNVAALWHPTKNGKLRPSNISVKSHQQVWWQCKDGHAHQAVVSNQVKQPEACGVCSGNQVLPGYNDLASQYPHLLVEWAYDLNNLTPEEITPYSDKVTWWRCQQGHEYDAQCKHKTKGARCPYCTNKRILVGYNDLLTTHPELAAQWHPTLNTINPTDVSFGSTKPVFWLCEECDHVWNTTPNTRTSGSSGGRGCNRCSTSRASQARSVPDEDASLNALFPDIAALWDYDKNPDRLPSEVYPNSGQKYWWKCALGHQSYRTVTSMTSSSKGGNACSICSGHIVLPGYNDLATRYPKVIEEWSHKLNDTTPDQVMPGSSKIFWWSCKEGHPPYQMSCDQRCSAVFTGCAYCNNLKVWTGYNDLASQYPALANEYSCNNPTSATEIYKQSGQHVQWVCSTNSSHVWRATVTSRTRLGSGCPHCVRGVTSKIEGLIRSNLALSSVFVKVNDDHLTRILVNSKRVQIDILAELPDGRNVIIEYDGEYYHSGVLRPNKPQRDHAITDYLLDEGYIVVRIREGNLFHLDIQHDNLLQISYRYSVDDDDVNLLVKIITSWIETL